jgi:hypothetical protein
MAKLIGYLRYGHHAGVIHRLAHKEISSELATWEGNIRTELYPDGKAFVYVNGNLVYKRNVNNKKRVIK